MIEFENKKTVSDKILKRLLQIFKDPLLLKFEASSSDLLENRIHVSSLLITNN